ncbi:MAG: hypothetical protein ACOCZ8_00240 [Bacteroidota bacterium]
MQPTYLTPCMLSHLSDIGFRMEEEEELSALVETLSNDGDPIPVRAGYYVVCRLEGGIELWMQFNRNGEWLGLNPHFRGESKLRLLLNHTIFRNDEQLDGAFHAWADPTREAIRASMQNERLQSGSLPGLFPFVFDLPDFHTLPGLQLPQVAEVQIAAFAHEMHCFDDEAQYFAAQDEADDQFAVESFIPLGLLTDDEQEEPEAFARLSGRVLKTEYLENPHTGHGFHWALVRTLGGEVDVLCDPDLLENAPEVGGIVSGDFWLSGRLCNPLELGDYEMLTIN